MAHDPLMNSLIYLSFQSAFTICLANKKARGDKKGI